VMGLPSGYLLDLKTYDPAAEAKRLTVPMLFLQGERDFQVNMKDFGIWKSALGSRKNAEFRSYPALNHLFIAGEGPSTPAEYRKAGNMDAGAVSDIVAFIMGSRR
jgi:fermentation-respiration switch protein FrsA (DUF1100 family)